VWNPYLSKDISRLETVQKFALQICLKDWNSPYHDLLEQCQLTELRSFFHLYKIIYISTASFQMHLSIPTQVEYLVTTSHALVTQVSTYSLLLVLMAFLFPACYLFMEFTSSIFAVLSICTIIQTIYFCLVTNLLYKIIY